MNRKQARLLSCSPDPITDTETTNIEFFSWNFNCIRFRRRRRQKIWWPPQNSRILIRIPKSNIRQSNIIWHNCLLFNEIIMVKFGIKFGVEQMEVLKHSLRLGEHLKSRWQKFFHKRQNFKMKILSWAELHYVIYYES